jgi:serine/threonine protein kinase
MPAAVKVIQKSMFKTHSIQGHEGTPHADANDEEAMRAIDNEVAILRRLQQATAMPHIVTFLDAFESDREVFLVFECARHS